MQARQPWVIRRRHVQRQLPEDPRERYAGIPFNGNLGPCVRLAEPIQERQTLFLKRFAGLLAAVPALPSQPQQPQMVRFQLEFLNNFLEPEPGLRP
jgi:hypothetical protein